MHVNKLLQVINLIAMRVMNASNPVAMDYQFS